MSPALRRAAVALAAALVLAAVDRSILAKERIRRDGAVVLLALRPVDPRSLMQGDYMALRFSLAEELEGRLLRHGAVAEDAGGGAGARPARAPGEGGFGWAPILVDGRGVATLAPSAAVSTPLRLRYRLRGGRAWLGTNAFFFREGEAARFSPARYGEFRLDRESGEAVLVGLRDGDLRPL